MSAKSGDPAIEFTERLHVGTFYLPGKSLVFVGDHFTDRELDAYCVIESIERIEAPDGHPEALKITAILLSERKINR